MLDHGGSRGTAFDQGDQVGQLVLLDGATIVRANLNVDPDDVPRADRLEKAGVEHQGATVRHASFDDHRRPQSVDRFLDANQVLGQLNDRSAHPGEAVDVLCVPTRANPRRREDLEALGRPKGVRRLTAGGLHRNETLFEVDRDHAARSMYRRYRSAVWRSGRSIQMPFEPSRWNSSATS